MYPEDSHSNPQSYHPANAQTEVSPSFQQSPHDFEPNNDFDFKVPPAEMSQGQGQSLAAENHAIPSNLMNADPYEVAPEVFEAFSYVEPITTNVGSDFDMSWLNNETM